MFLRKNLRHRNAKTRQVRRADAFRVTLEKRKAAAASSPLSLGEGLGVRDDLRLLGPAEAPVFRLKGYFRFHFKMHSASSATLHQMLRAVLPTVRVPHGVELTVDIDPQDML